jgi:hypothetical protein
MKRMTEGGGDYLRKGWTQRTGRICRAVRLHSQLAADGAGDGTQFMNHSTLLCRHQQQQKAQQFERMSHSSWRSTTQLNLQRYQIIEQFAVSAAGALAFQPAKGRWR